MVESQKQVAAALRQLADAAKSPVEKERLEYLTRHVGILVPYAEAWTLAQGLHLVLQAAAELKGQNRMRQGARQGAHGGRAAAG